MLTFHTLFRSLPGIWKITRNIISQIQHENLKITGHGTFITSHDDTNLLLYSEKVNVNVRGKVNTGTQKYRYKYDPTKPSVSKYFNDGRFFYELKILDIDKMMGEHLCIKDKYTAQYIFKEDHFTLTYAVKGPSKSYKIITEYTKLPLKMI
ncbi:hypothetical protein phytr_5950 [Candidatus Phycorickettsia trachydisci]|uniref:NAD(+)--protein-arginine ADP-ribosyltransferase n=1 Tax=Candidatus Phycorickettsia trachydisci TaxID=2115978 RepID=A0A2P1P8F4_9RICK|nr:DUF6314 family protein [Candidatus Phycorickettsia trachydisci]AVP87536.1 hypothetical protein phytr_5950 [Candidatus Phycorickettsia trachydisci]